MMFRAVVVGCGAMARGWMKALARIDAVRVVGLVDLDEACARALAAEFGLEDAAVGTDLDAMLADLEPDLLFDIVVPSAREAVVNAGLAHGCHVLSEKPMAHSLEAARSLLAAAEAAGRIHAVVQNRRFVPGVRRLRRAVEAGTIGELTALHCDFFKAPHFVGFREEMGHVLILDMAIHTFDAARYLSGKTPLAVYCHETNPKGSWYADGAAANAVFELADDAVLTYRGSWCADGLPTSWEGAWRLVGTKGSLAWDGADGFAGEAVTAAGGFFSETAPAPIPALGEDDRVEGHVGVIRDFVDSLRDGRVPETDARDNIRSLAMVFAAIESAESGRRVTIDPLGASPGQRETS